MMVIGITCGIIIVAILVMGFFEYQYTRYECANCGKLHKPKVWRWVINLPVGEWKELKCPWCGDKNWHRRNMEE